MAKRARGKVQPIKSSPTIPVESGKLHHVILVDLCHYTSAKCTTCGRGALCGGDTGEKNLRQWAEWHAKNTEIHVQGDELESK